MNVGQVKTLINTLELSGFTVGANTSILDTDNRIQAFGKIQAQINAISGVSGDYYLKTGGSVSGAILADGGIDVTATGGSDTLYVGTVNADVITIGRAGITVNILGSVLNYQATNSYVKDQLITLNKGGGASTAVGTGFEFEEDSAITGYFKTNGTRNGWITKVPAITNTVELLYSSLTDNRSYIYPDNNGTFALTSDLHNPITLGTANGLSLATQVLSLSLASTSVTGALSSTDWNTFNSKQNALSYTAADDSTVVHTSGTENIGGAKSFTLGIGIGNTATSTIGAYIGSLSVPFSYGVASYGTTAAIYGIGTTSLAYGGRFENNSAGTALRASQGGTGADAAVLYVSRGTTGGAEGTLPMIHVVRSDSSTGGFIEFWNSTKAFSLDNTGTIVVGSWNASKISEVYGGTNQSTYTTGDTLYASATNTLSKLPIGTNGYVYTVVSGIPGWTALPSSISGLTSGYIPVATSSTTLGNSLLRDNGTLLSYNMAPATNTILTRKTTGDTSSYFADKIYKSDGSTGIYAIDGTGAITLATWNGTSIGDPYISSASTWNAKQSALTISSGLTNSGGTITANLITGLSGGQTIIGDTAANGSITITGTSHATKTTSKIILGTIENVTIGGATASGMLSIKGAGSLGLFGIKYFQNDGTTVSFSATDAGDVVAKNSITVTGYTSGRLLYTTTAGLFAASPKVTFDGTLFAVSGVSSYGRFTNSATGLLGDPALFVTSDARYPTASITDGSAVLMVYCTSQTGLSHNALAIGNHSVNGLSTGLGVSMSWEMEGKNRAFAECVLDTITGGAEDSRLNLKVMSGGALVTPLSLIKDKVSIPTGKINITSIPTSSSGLSSGDIWSNLGILTIV